MSQAQAPEAVPTSSESVPLVLPRPNLAPEPWSARPPVWTPLELGVVGGMVGLVATLAILKWRRRPRTPARGDALDSTPGDGSDLTPSHRLIASSTAVRAALIAQFGTNWGSRTTPEIAADPALADRLGLALADAVVAYLDQVDRAKFAGEEVEDAEPWINSARDFLGQFPPVAEPNRRAGRA